MRRTEEQLRAKILVAPLQWLGNSDHHLDFAGTLSAPPRVYLDLLNGLIDNFVMHGFKRLVFINGHGGNHVPGQQAVFEARQRYRERDDLLLLFATYWLLGAEPHKQHSELKQTQMGHACEWETSMVLRIRPELVGDVKKLETVPFGNPFLPASRGWITKDRTAPGHIGEPQHGTAEKGEKLFLAFTESTVAMLQRVIAWDGQSWEG
jgi:creatinine amidohydrolase